LLAVEFALCRQIGTGLARYTTSRKEKAKKDKTTATNLKTRLGEPWWHWSSRRGGIDNLTGTVMGMEIVVVFVW